MPLNNKQDTFDWMRTVMGMTPQQAYDALFITADCCRTIMSTSAADARLQPRLPVKDTFAQPVRLSALHAAPYMVRADGTSTPAPYNPT